MVGEGAGPFDEIFDRHIVDEVRHGQSEDHERSRAARGSDAQQDGGDCEPDGAPVPERADEGEEGARHPVPERLPDPLENGVIHKRSSFRDRQRLLRADAEYIWE